MKNKLNERLVVAVQDNISDKWNIVTFLMDLLDLSRESVYRRVRGDIPFTLEEAAIITKGLGISMDEIISQNNKERVFFDLNIEEPEENDSVNSNVFSNINKIHEKMIKAQSSECIIAYNRIPILFTSHYEYVKKFRYYKWMHQTFNVPLNFYYSDLIIPQKLGREYKKFIYSYSKLRNISIIIDRYTFKTVIDEAIYYYRRRLVSMEELREIQKEMFDIINDLEQLLKTGKNKENSNINIYLSSLDIESNSSFFHYDDDMCTFFWVYTINPIIVFNKEVCLAQKKWMDSLMKYSTLITKSNESQRAEFINEQRSYIENMTNDVSRLPL